MSLRDSLFLSLQSHGFQRLRRVGRAWRRPMPSWARPSPRSPAAGSTCAAATCAPSSGAGAGAGIAAAFGAPLTGAFYAFEIIIGSYAVANIAPVVGAALAGALVAHFLGERRPGRPGRRQRHPGAVPLSAVRRSGRGLRRRSASPSCAWWRWPRAAADRLPGPSWLRPAFGGLLLAALAWSRPRPCRPDTGRWPRSGRPSGDRRPGPADRWPRRPLRSSPWASAFAAACSSPRCSWARWSDGCSPSP